MTTQKETSIRIASGLSNVIKSLHMKIDTCTLKRDIESFRLSSPQIRELGPGIKANSIVLVSEIAKIG